MTKIEVKLINSDRIVWTDPDNADHVEAVFEAYLLRQHFITAFLEDGSTAMIPVSSIAYVNISKED